MRDRALRAAEHRLQADPDDQDALQQAILARQRSGLPVPGWMHARSLSPARSLQLSVPVDVGALLPDGRSVGLGRTGEAPLQIPEHRTFWITPPTPSDLSVAELGAELVAQSVPGLSLGSDFSEDGLRALAPLAEHLTYLDLSACRRAMSGLRELHALSCLATLRLWYCVSLDDAGLEALGGVKGLSTLDLGNCTGFAEGALDSLLGLEELTVLRLGSCRQIGDLGVGLLRRLPRLTSLDLRHCVRLSDAGLAALAGAPELTVLNLSFCDSLTLGGLAQLVALPRLSQLYLAGCGLEAEAVGALFADTRCEVIL